MQTAKSDECMNPPVTKELVLERLCDVTAAYTAFVVSYGEKVREPRERPVLNVEVTELFKGESYQRNSVLSPGYVGPRLNVGQEVLIFAYEVPATDYLEVRSCSVSGPLSRTNVYLEPIRKAMSDFDENCSKSARDVRAEVLRNQSKENMQRIRERNDRGLSEQRERKNESPASNSNEP